MNIVNEAKLYNFDKVRQITDNTFEIVNNPESWLLIINDNNVKLLHCNARHDIGKYHLQKNNITIKYALNYIKSHKSFLYENKSKKCGRLEELFLQISGKK